MGQTRLCRLRCTSRFRSVHPPPTRSALTSTADWHASAAASWAVLAHAEQRRSIVDFDFVGSHKLGRPEQRAGTDSCHQFGLIQARSYSLLVHKHTHRCMRIALGSAQGKCPVVSTVLESGYVFQHDVRWTQTLDFRHEPSQLVGPTVIRLLEHVYS